MPMTTWNEYLKLFIGLIAIVNPIGAIPIFLALTDNLTKAEKKKTIKISAFSLSIILLVTLFIGEDILSFFGIEVASFRIAGGVLIFLMALSMLHGHKSEAKGTTEEKMASVDKDSIGVVPLAIPLLGGPGAISTLIVYANEYNTTLDYLVISFIIVAVSALTFLTLKLAPSLERLLGRIGINVMTRIMGLMIASIAVEFIVKGIKHFFPS